MPQDSKNALPSEFGGEGSQDYFKPKGKQAFLARVTKITAVLFFINACLLLKFHYSLVYHNNIAISRLLCYKSHIKIYNYCIFFE